MTIKPPPLVGDKPPLSTGPDNDNSQVGGEKRQPVICSSCGTPVAEWQGDVLVIVAKHHGETHVTTICPAGVKQGDLTTREK